MVAQGPVDFLDLRTQLFRLALKIAARLVVWSMSLMPCCENLIVVMNVAIGQAPFVWVSYELLLRFLRLEAGLFILFATNSESSPP